MGNTKLEQVERIVKLYNKRNELNLALNQSKADSNTLMLTFTDADRRPQINSLPAAALPHLKHVKEELCKSIEGEIERITEELVHYEALIEEL